MSAIRERPILFSGPMVRAILDGRKTQTRRLVKPQPEMMTLYDDLSRKETGREYWCMYPDSPDARKRTAWLPDESPEWSHCPYGVPGDRLWVRETFHWLDMRPEALGFDYAPRPTEPCPVAVGYAADHGHKDCTCPPEEWRESMDNDAVQWRPSIHMPRWASRLTLEVTEVRVQRLQEITHADAVAEGMGPDEMRAVNMNEIGDPVAGFSWLWDSINAKRGHGWESNPWVWALTFRTTTDHHHHTKGG